VVGGIVAGASGAGVGLVFLVWWVRRAWRRTAVSVVKALHRGEERQVRVFVLEATGGTWKPTKSGELDNRIFEPGRGTYRLDEGGDVVLDWQPAHGSTVRYTGPVPATLNDPSQQRRRSKVLRLIIAVEAGAIAAGFSVAFLVSSGSVATRLGWGLLGIFAGQVAVWLLTLVLNVGHGIRGVARASATGRNA
jgi:hypothetical protein